jgi:hypothetical protein
MTKNCSKVVEIRKFLYIPIFLSVLDLTKMTFVPKIIYD